jgi:rare lipoprotein A
MKEPWLERALVMMVVLILAGCAPSPRYTSAVRPWVDTSPGSLKRIQEGMASFYGGDFHGRKTANGEIYDMYTMTAAHRALPFNTRVLVTNLDNGKEVEVRINDRGPFIKGRIIDLSYGAARKIGMVGPGTARVRLEVMEMGEEQ